MTATKARPAVLVLVLGLLTVIIAVPAHAEFKLAILKVRGMVCSG